jgi:hypothetical protein
MSGRNETAITSRIADKHGVSAEAVATALSALREGGGGMAQFSHPAFGGMAQWSSGGMSMVGDMFNKELKSKLDGVMTDLATALKDGSLGEKNEPADHSREGSSRSKTGEDWPSELGQPSSSGSQNDMRYAFFPESRRLVVEDSSGRITYDTGEHRITGVSQQQSGDRTITFTSQNGPVSLASLRVVD